jgi:hypothetical protein
VFICIYIYTTQMLCADVYQNILHQTLRDVYFVIYHVWWHIKYFSERECPRFYHVRWCLEICQYEWRDQHWTLTWMRTDRKDIRRGMKLSINKRCSNIYKCKTVVMLFHMMLILLRFASIWIQFDLYSHTCGFMFDLF